jgi:cytochrome P450
MENGDRTNGSLPDDSNAHTASGERMEGAQTPLGCHFSSGRRSSFTEADVQRNPFPLVDDLLGSDAPIVIDPVSGFYVASRWADLDYINGRPDLFSSEIDFIFFRKESPLWPEMKRRYEERGFLPMHTLVTADPPVHTRYRALVDRVFTARNVSRLEPRITEIVDGLINQFIARGHAELVSELANQIPLIVIAEQMGIRQQDQSKLKYYGDLSLERLNPNIVPERELAIVDELVEFQRFVHDRAEEYRVAPGDTLFSRLVHTEIDGEPMSARALVNLVHILLIAGHETTAAGIASAIYLLLARPDIRATLESDSTLIPNFVEEALRIHPPILQQYRVVMEETELHGVRLPKGSMLLTSQVCANYDPGKWSDPKQVDLARRGVKQHFSFGRGIHYCVGNVLARSEMRIAIERLLKRLPALQLDPDKPAPEWASRFHTHSLLSINVRF